MAAAKQQQGRPTLQRIPSQTRKLWGDWMLDNRNPDEIVATKGYDYYRLMLKNPYVKAAIQTRVNAVVGRWEGATPHVPATPHDREFVGQILTNGKDRGEEKQALSLARLNLDEWLKREGWSAILSRALYGAITMGFSVSEVIWGYRDSDKKPFGGKWYIKGIDECVQEYFQFDVDGSMKRSQTIWDYTATVACEPYKYLVVTYDQQYANRYGESLLRSLVRIEWFERNAWSFWLMFLEKFGAPTIVGKVPDDAGDEDRKRLLDIIDLVRNHTGIVINQTDALTLLEATRQGEAGYPVLIELCHKLYAIVITGNALTLAPDKTGSFAMAGATTVPVREDILYADCEMLDRAMSFQPLYYLTAFNFSQDIEYYPFQRILPPKVQTVTDAELLQRAQRDMVLWQMGVPMPLTYIQQTYRIPEVKDGEAILPAFQAQAQAIPQSV